MAVPRKLIATPMAVASVSRTRALSRNLHSASRSIFRAATVPAKRQRSTQSLIQHANEQVRWQSNVPKDQETPKAEQPNLNSQLATTLQQSDQSDLVTEVKIPPDPDGILPPDHPAMSLLGNSSLVIQRQIEFMNVIIGIEQANRYIIMDGQGNTIGYIAEQDHGIGQSLMRQAAKTHRSFTTHIFDQDQREVLRIHRPFAYINSRIRIYDPIPEGGYQEDSMAVSSTQDVPNGQISPLKLDEMRIIGECQQVWSAVRRKYNLFTLRPDEVPESSNISSQAIAHATESKISDKAIEASMTQFSLIDEPMLSWDFTAKLQDGQVIGNVNRNFGGFAREIFTDTGVYALRMDAAAQMSAASESAANTENPNSADKEESTEIAKHEAPGLTLDQRAVLIATAISIDFDYFSRHSSHAGGMGFMPIMWPMGGGAAAEGGAAGAGAVGGIAAGEAGVGAGVGAMEGLGGAAGAAGRGVTGAGAVESGIAGAGTMAGYEAMQRGFGRGDSVDDTNPSSSNADASPQAFDQGYDSPLDETNAGAFGQGENQPSNDDAWGADQDPWSEQTPSAGDGEEGGGIIDTIMSWFSD